MTKHTNVEQRLKEIEAKLALLDEEVTNHAVTTIVWIQALESLALGLSDIVVKSLTRTHLTVPSAIQRTVADYKERRTCQSGQCQQHAAKGGTRFSEITKAMERMRGFRKATK